MKINKISLKNLASFEGEHEIDFTQEPLASAGLYAICGDTGSGKSTLLDAICLALYHKVPRYEGISTRIDSNQVDKDATKVSGLQPDDPRNIMRRGQKEAYSKVEFEDAEGGVYVATWSCHITRNNTFADYTQHLEQIAPKKRVFNDSKTEFRQAIIDLTHLNYDQFCRTVMLAQNSFATFLKADKKAKSELLEKLTGTEIYGRISKQIYSSHAQACQELERVKSRLEGLSVNLLSAEALATQQQELKALQEAVRQSQQQVERLAEQIKWVEIDLQLEANLKKEEESWGKAQRAQDSLAAEQRNYSRYISAHPIQTQYLQRKEARERLKDENEKYLLIQQKMTQEKANEKSCQQKLAEIQKKLSQQTKALEDAQPQFNQARKYQGEMLSIHREWEELKGNVQQLEDQLEKVKACYLDKHRQQQLLQQQYLELKTDKEGLADHASMFDRYEVIALRLEDFKKVCEGLKTDIVQFENTRLLKQEQEKSLAKCQQELQTLQAEIMQPQHDLEELNIQRLNTELEAARANETKLLNTVEQYKTAQNLWKSLSERYHQEHRLQEQMQGWKNSIPALEAACEKAKQEATASQTKLKATEQRLLLAQSKDFKSLRMQLQEGETCPLCGSKTHPFHVTSEIENEHMLEQLSKVFHVEKEQAEQANMAYEKQVEELTRLKFSWKHDEENLMNIQKDIQNETRLWEELELLDDSLKKPAPLSDLQSRTSYILRFKDDAERQLAEQQAKLKALNEAFKKSLALSAKVKTLSDKVRSKEQLVAAQQNRMNSLEQEYGQWEKRISEARIAEANMVSELGQYITWTNWRDQWKVSSEGFKQKLKEQYLRWKKICETLEQTDEAIKELTQQKDKAETEGKQFKTQLHYMQEKQEKLSAKYHQYEEYLSNTFHTLDIDSVEQQMQQQRKETEQEYRQQEEALQTILSTLKHQQGTSENMKATINMLNENIAALQTQMDGWLERFNREHTPLKEGEMERLFSAENNWEEVKQKIEAAASALVAAQTKCEAVRHQRSEHREKGQELGDCAHWTLPELNRKYQEESAVLQQVTARQATCQQVINAHLQAEINTQQEQKQLQAAEENRKEWASLNELFGSANGQRFKEIAQQYTFRTLVYYANQQLQLFSPRYALDVVPQSLTLNIVDREMLDRERYVSSLSGGETFVVSLALALGLSYLSSDGLSIRSLFIDEGFGHLDRESLQLVMQALSNLDTTLNRKVGVISHTEQIREQISPQIQIKKISGGVAKSHIVVV